MKSNRLLHWRLLVEEFLPKFEYVPGPSNVVADQLLRLPLTASERKNDLDELQAHLIDSFLFYPEDVPVFPLGFPAIAQAQQNDPILLALLQQGIYTQQQFGETQLICYQQDQANKIVLPSALHQDATAWYHFVLGHVGIQRLIKSLNSFCYIEGLKKKVEEFVLTCESCQKNKNQGPGYGHLPPREDTSVPWNEVAVDLIGPWPIQVAGVGDLEVFALTVIDTCTTLAELI